MQLGTPAGLITQRPPFKQDQFPHESAKKQCETIILSNYIFQIVSSSASKRRNFRIKFLVTYFTSRA
jgi:hypothetical protein